jgi:hypothetical protein
MSPITESNKQRLDERVRVLVDTYDEVRMLCGEGSYDGLTLSTIVEGIFKLKLLTDLCESTVAELGIYEPMIECCEFIEKKYKKALPRDRRSKKKMQEYIDKLNSSVDIAIDITFDKLFSDPEFIRRNARVENRWALAVGVDTVKLVNTKILTLPDAKREAQRFKDLLNNNVRIDTIPRDF